MTVCTTIMNQSLRYENLFYQKERNILSSIYCSDWLSLKSWSYRILGGRGFCPTLVRSHLQCCLQFWGPQHKNMDLLERVQGRPRMMRELKHLSNEDKLGAGIVQPGEKKASGRPYDGLLALKGGLWNGDRLFSMACSDRTRGNGFKLKEFQASYRKKFVMMRVVKQWDRLPREVFRCPILGNVQGHVGQSCEPLDQVEDVPSTWVGEAAL